MGMQSFDKEELSAPLAEINTTPLVDVMLVLMIIFLVTAPMLTNSIKLQLPNETAAKVNEQKVITISLNEQGKYYWDETEISEEMLESKMKAAAGNDIKQPIHIRADTNIAYGKVSHILALAQKFGLNNIGFITEPR